MPSTSHMSRTSAMTSSLTAMRLLPAVAAICIAVMASTSCKEEKKEIISAVVDPETFPTMLTTDVSTVISDSGITRYLIETPLWLMYEEATDPYWRFPDGMHLEKYDNDFNTEASIDCDSARYLKNRQLWQLDGYVNIRNTVGEKFLTNQLFWDQRSQKIYSDSFIHIERQGKIIEGYGFESDERMTRYHVLRVSGIFPAEQFRTDSTKRAAHAADTAANATETRTNTETSGHDGAQPAIIAPGRRIKLTDEIKEIDNDIGRSTEIPKERRRSRRHIQ